MPQPAPPERARLGLVFLAVLLLWLVGTATYALAQTQAPPDSLLPGTAPVDTSKGAPAAPDSLIHQAVAPAAADSLVHQTVAPDSLAQVPVTPDTLLQAPATSDSTRKAAAQPAPGAPPAGKAGKPFEQIPLATNYGESHMGSNLAIAGGVALIGVSFVLGHAANDTYDAYLRETDPQQIDELYDRTVLLDRGASGTLLLGEALVCAGLYGRFLRHPPNAVMAFRLEPGRCAVSYRF